MRRLAAMGLLAALFLLSGCQTYDYGTEEQWDATRPHGHTYQAYYGVRTNERFYHYPPESYSDEWEPYAPTEPEGAFGNSTVDGHGVREHVSPDQEYDYPYWVEEDDYRPWPYSGTYTPRYYR